jgi:hypothetical protein
MNFSIEFIPGYCNGNMQMSARVNGVEKCVWHETQRITNAKLCFDHDIDLFQPFCIELVFSGKNQDTDTDIVNGEIVQDKFIQVETISIDSIVLRHELFLFPFLTDNKSTITNTNYFGFNGIYTLSIQPDLPTWLIDCASREEIDIWVV